MPPHSVVIPPGSMTTTWIPKGRASRRSASLSASSANFVPWYQPPSGVWNRPPIEEMLMIVPERRSRMCGRTSWVSRMAPKTLTSNWRRASCSGMSSIAP